MTQDDQNICRICSNREGNRIVQAREMMFGSRERFDYLACGACGTLQILAVPEDLSRHYPSDYYSFAMPRMRQNRVKTYLRGQRARFYLGQPTLVGRFAAHPEPRRPRIFRFLKAIHATQETPILDVGCGSGRLLVELWHYGFRDLTGIDPFLPQDIQFAPGLRVLRRSLEELEQPCPVVMMHHSFEHMPDPRAVFRKAAALLTEHGTLMVRIPLAGSFCCQHYGPDWVQMDAPRHLFLHTERSVGLLAEAAGLKIREVIYDSEAFQFWGSEQYRNDIPLLDPRSHFVDPKHSRFSPQELQGFAERAEQLNAAGAGDQACFLLGHA